MKLYVNYGIKYSGDEDVPTGMVGIEYKIERVEVSEKGNYAAFQCRGTGRNKNSCFSYTLFGKKNINSFAEEMGVKKNEKGGLEDLVGETLIAFKHPSLPMIYALGVPEYY